MKILIVFCTGFLYINQAEAYLDSGSGSMLIQLLLGGLVGVGAFIKFYWYKISAFFKALYKKNKK